MSEQTEKVKTMAVCNLCGEKWESVCNPGTCIHCHKPSFGMVWDIKDVKNGDKQND